MATKKLSPTLAGVAGEYFVAGELSRRGNIASITLRNTKGVDILVANEDATRTAQIQVKTCTGKRRSWIVSKKAESIAEAGLFYVFVFLGEDGTTPSYHIVPSSVVASYVRTSHSNWLAGTKADGSPRRDTDMRKFNDEDCHYLNAWDLLGLE